MNMQQIAAWRTHAVTWIYKFLLVQLFINLIAWPILLGWGLPVTPLSIIGNLIFSPFLTAFLMLSSLAVTFELLSLPSGLFLYLLEQLTAFWLWIAACPTPDCMITCVTPPLFLTLCAPVGATLIMLYKPFKTPAMKVYAMLALYVVLIALFSLLPQPRACTIPYGSNSVTIQSRNNKLFMVDPGFNRRASGITTWINYTLLPALGSNFGRQSVDYLVIKKRTPSTQLYAQELRARSIATTVIFQDAHAKTTPSSRVSPSNRSKNPSSQNPLAPRYQESPRAWQR